MIYSNDLSNLVFETERATGIVNRRPITVVSPTRPQG
jgi:hypothetical protein